MTVLATEARADTSDSLQVILLVGTNNSNIYVKKLKR